MFHFSHSAGALVTRRIECVSCKEVFIISEDYVQQYSQRPFINCPRCGADNQYWIRIAYASPPGNLWKRFLSRTKRFGLTGISYALTLFLLLRLLWRESVNDNLIAYGLLLVIMVLGTLIPIWAITGQWRNVRTHKIISKFDKTQSFFSQISPTLKQGVFYFTLFVLMIPFLIYILLPWTTDTFIKEKPLVERIDQIMVQLNEENLLKLQGEEMNSLAPTENALAGMQGLMHKNLFLCNPDAIDSVLTKLESINTQSLTPETAVLVENGVYHLNKLQTAIQDGTCTPNLVANAIIPLSTLYAEEWQKCASVPDSQIALDPDCSDPIIASMVTYVQIAGDPGGTLADEIQLTLQDARVFVQETNDPAVIARIESEVAIIEKAIGRANNGSSATPGTSTMLNTWMKYVGLSCLVAVITAVVATEIYVGQISYHLPQPICNSLLNMTGVVQWEIDRSLESEEELKRIEWTGAERNQHGGINMEGLRRMPNDTASGNYVRAHKYIVSSDIWGNLMQTAVKIVRVHSRH